MFFSLAKVGARALRERGLSAERLRACFGFLLKAAKEIRTGNLIDFLDLRVRTSVWSDRVQSGQPLRAQNRRRPIPSSSSPTILTFE